MRLHLLLLAGAAATGSAIVTRGEHAVAEVADGSVQSKAMRVLLYVTTAGSYQHMSFLECYPQYLEKQPEFTGMTDVLLQVAEEKPGSDHRHQRFQDLLNKWPVHGRQIRYTDNPGKQAGAIKAMHDAFSNGWFNGYDWVIRINPDVIIWDSSRLLSLMKQERNWGVFVTCGKVKKWGGLMTGTDFFAVRPEQVPANAFADWKAWVWKGYVAEAQATRAFQQIYKSGNYSWLKSESKPRIHACHLEDGGIHHAWRDDQCVPEKLAKDMDGHARLPHVWQEAWRTGGPEM